MQKAGVRQGGLRDHASPRRDGSGEGGAGINRGYPLRAVRPRASPARERMPRARSEHRPGRTRPDPGRAREGPVRPEGGAETLRGKGSDRRLGEAEGARPAPAGRGRRERRARPPAGRRWSATRNFSKRAVLDAHSRGQPSSPIGWHGPPQSPPLRAWGRRSISLM